MRYLVSLLLLFGCFGQSRASIGELVIFRDSTTSIDVSTIAWFFEDPDHTATVESFYGQNSGFETVQGNNFDFTTSRFWGTFVLDFGYYPRTFYVQIARPVTNKVHLYEVDWDWKVIREWKSGDDYSFSDRATLNRHNVFKIETDSGFQRRFVVMLESDGELLTVPIVLSTEEVFAQHTYHEQWLLGLYYGIFLFVILIYSFFYYVLKERSFLYYVIYVLGIALLQLSLDGYIFQYVFPNSPWWANHIVLLSAAFTGVFALLYSKTILKTAQNLPKINRVFQFFLILIGIVGVLSLFPGPTYTYNFPVINISTLLSILLVPITILISTRRGFKVDRFFTMAYVVLVASTTVFILRNLSVLPDNLFTEHSLKLGSALQVIFLSFSMANRYRLLQQEKEEAQAATLAQLEEKNRLQEGMNERLELQVKERTHEINEKKEQLAEQNKDILDSIRYAQRLQTAILPSDSTVKEILPDSFILYKPRDIVSGDFYWAANVTNSDESTLAVFAAADCTGHGVPGAFVSIMGANYLKLGQTAENVNTPAQALDFLNQGVNSTLNQRSDESTVRDGMDIAICALDYAKMRLHFAGAKNPVYIIRAGEFGEDELGLHKLADGITSELVTPTHKLIEIKGDKQPIGAFMGSGLQPFTDRSFELKEADTIYLFSDGYADQFGGMKGKKFMYKKFKELLLSIQGETLPRQNEILDKTIVDWMETVNTYGESHEQLDDILVMAVKVRARIENESEGMN
jgi:serine phosphatase RsbU (regulator of sigma subunit)